ncbi:ABC transporter permease [Granulicatella sp. zg-ZJ]|uniref:ABC transporter permease n=1 Tax=unclassified Granulicatella TaxID=2630493 RepID=UPI0013C0525E|nr:MULTISPECIES: ABC transporter permease [unclassified Granulicatella]MBS4749969.1 ABC transporter permease [Carnobacteriaceae bacterium zg-ZUI78]NEW62035.1 ABC transporter permease [Granulicatella sp. zg-ZJ]NEW66167.1 ABC transporter permease [Granulicatella sp. zg-84]QMI86075.1 ABC transporter permease [Carnobacteriaceae bacterium zg-84]
MKNSLITLKKYLPLLWELIMRDVKLRYRKSVLGVFWTLLNPLMMMAVMSVVFAQLFRFDIENYPLYVLSGQLVFNFFSESTSLAMSSIISNAALIRKIYIPKYLFTVSKILSSLINILSSLCALIIVMMITKAEFHSTIFFVFIPIGLLTVFSLGVGLFLSSFVVKFRDIIHLYSVLLTVLLYLMPVIYNMSILPSFILPFVKYNPLTQILVFFRDVTLYGVFPDPMMLLYTVVVCFVTLGIGLRVFYKLQDTFILNI